mmetsp:Transcript_20979/g.59849  ORF Transcript_20979/g.59849 Transcript_20979/m.59849 type:complete len:252 (-) Transcript_20979:143-898(-)
MAALPLVPRDERMVRKELQQGAACVSAWYVPTTSIALLPELLLLVVNAVPFYWLAGIADDAAAFALTLLSQVLIVVTFHSVGLLLAVGATFTRANSGTLSMLFMSFCFLFTGIFVPPSQMPLPELRFANPLYYATSLIAQLVFLQGTEYASPVPGGPPVPRDEVLATLGIGTPASGWCALILVAFASVARCGALLLLQWRLRRDLQQSAAAAGPARRRWCLPGGGPRLLFRRRRPKRVGGGAPITVVAAAR